MLYVPTAYLNQNNIVEGGGDLGLDLLLKQF